MLRKSKKFLKKQCQKLHSFTLNICECLMMALLVLCTNRIKNSQTKFDFKG